MRDRQYNFIMKRIELILLAVIVSMADVCAQQFNTLSSSTSGIVTKKEIMLDNGIKKIVVGIPAEVGVMFWTYDGKGAFFGDEEHFPLLSVVKFHQALAVCNELKQRGKTLSDNVKVTKQDLRKDTWSPMIEKYPSGGVLTIEELLRYSLVMSDNNACDILFNNVVGVGQTNDFIKSICDFECQIAVNEKSMGEDMMRCYDNWTTPRAIVSLWNWFYNVREEHIYNDVWQMMAECETGHNRIPRYLSDDVVVVHKTGTGPAVDGRIIAVNDVACVILPDGRYFFLAVFIKDAYCPMEKCEDTIAQIAKLCMKFMY